MPAGTGYFAIAVDFKHENKKSVEELMNLAFEAMGRKDLSGPKKVLDENWVDTVGDLRLLIQEGQLRTLGLPLRLCVWIEEELAKVNDGPPGKAAAALSVISDDVKAPEPVVPLKSPVLSASPQPLVIPSSGIASMGGIMSPPPLSLQADEKLDVFKYQSDFDTNGIMYWLGTKGGRQPWVNPAVLGAVRVITSGMLSGSAPESAMVGREVVRCVTSSNPNAFFCVDLMDRRVMPTHYTLRHYSSWATESLRSWRFEGALGYEEKWTVLREHKDDPSLEGIGQACTWPIEKAAELHAQGYSFTRFRVMMTGPNSNKHLYLACSGFELYGYVYKQPLVAQQKAPSLNNASELEFKHTAPFDENGIIHYLATADRTRPYENPVKTGQVVITASSIMHDSYPLSAVVGQDVVRCVTRPEPNSWIKIDFLDKEVAPVCYCMRHYSSWDTEAVRNWRFEGTSDGVTWVTLREHVNDEGLDKKGATHTWDLPPIFHNQRFKAFRIFQTGPNSNNHHYLAVSGFEIYGKLYVDKKAPENAIQKTDFEYGQDPIGIITYIGMQGGRVPWTNPAIAGLVKITASSLMNDSTPAFCVVGKEVVRCVTKPLPNSWFVIDLLDKRVRPTAYMLRHYSSWDVEAVRNWNFEGSNDGSNWTVLRKHRNDESITMKGQEHVWKLDKIDQAFQMFRILQWGPNSNNHHYLSLSGFELWGHVEPAPPQPVQSIENKTSWNSLNKSPYLDVDAAQGTVVNRGSQDKWQMIRSTQAVSKGKQRFAVKIARDAKTSNTWRFIIGVIPESFPPSGKEWVGAHSSWGYIAGTGGKCHQIAKSWPYGEPYGEGDVVGVALDFDLATIEFVKNGVGQGPAFRNLVGPVNLAISFTGTDAMVQLVEPNWIEQKMEPAARLNIWDAHGAAKFVVVDEGTGVATNSGSNDKWQAVRSVRTFDSGIHEFSVLIVESPPTPNHWRFIVGVVPPEHPLTWVGASNSWGYIGGTGGKCFNVGASTPYAKPFGDKGDVVTCRLNFVNSTIEFFKNGESQGVAFTNLKGPVHAGVSMTATGAKVLLKDIKTLS